jgi:hypothetical protein
MRKEILKQGKQIGMHARFALKKAQQQNFAAFAYWRPTNCHGLFVQLAGNHGLQV